MGERVAAAVLLLLVTLAAWAWLLAGAGMDMAAMAAMADMTGPMGPWSATDAAVMMAMWVVMMAAMMLPSATPAALAVAGVARGAAVPFVGGYLLAWSGFSIAATAAQWALDQAALLSHAMALASRVLAGAGLVLAGVWQLTPWKQACLRHCRSPMDLLLHRWRDGVGGGLRMGVEHGLYCLGCCWALMLLLFVGGVMSFAWIGGLALYVLIEKTAPAGHWIGRVAGLVLIGWGGAVLLRLPGSAG
jgi:predicted metal-binding membrane protein